jgi:dTDP-glucose pyrophosphorylase
MYEWRKACVAPHISISSAMAIIDASSLQIALVVDDGYHLMGIITDGDIRRAILKGVPFDRPISEIMFKNFTKVDIGESRENILRLMKEKGLRHIPVIDEDGKIVDLKVLMDLVNEPSRPNVVFIMAGGLGTRLRPLTNDCPKPMVKVGNKPILETIIDNFVDHGFTNFVISVNYKRSMIENYFRDGSDFGAKIRYLREDKRMGTAGALSLLTDKPVDPVIVMNGDLLTKISFSQLLDFHKDHNAVATMCVRQYEMRVPYGVVDVDEHIVLNLEEKPLHSFFVNAGIYVLNPQIIEFIPKDRFYDMTDLFQDIIKKKKPISAFPIREYWLDVGRIPDYHKANGDYANQFCMD